MAAPQSLSINLADRRVQELLGQEDRVVRPGSARRELVHLAGDADAPDGRGLSSTHRADALKEEVRVTYKDFVLTVDVYRHPGEPAQVHLICPRCRHQLRVTADRKAIDFEPTDNVAAGGRLSIEPFECTWEMGNDEHHQGALFAGTTLCRWKVGITNNIAKDA